MSKTSFDAFMDESAHEANDELFSEAVLFDMGPSIDTISRGQLGRGSNQRLYFKQVSFQLVL